MTADFFEVLPYVFINTIIIFKLNQIWAMSDKIKAPKRWLRCVDELI